MANKISSLSELTLNKLSPVGLADVAGRTLFQKMIQGYVNNINDLENQIIQLGKGADAVRDTTHYRVLKFVLSK